MYLDPTSMVKITDLWYGFQGNIFARQRALHTLGQDNVILPSWLTDHSAGFDKSYPHTELTIN